MPSAVAQGALAVQIRTPFDERSLAVKEMIAAFPMFKKPRRLQQSERFWRILMVHVNTVVLKLSLKAMEF